MYIESKGNTNYLIKKTSGKKISVNIGKDNLILKDHIKTLSQKEFDFLSSQDEYNNFKNELYNKDLLDEIFFESLLLSNQINNNLFSNNELNNKYKDFAIKFIYESNKTEGSKIPFQEVQNIIKQKKYAYKIKNEIKEVENSIKTWEFVNNKFLFNIANIKKLYHILTSGLIQENGQKYPRGFKKVNIVVNNNITCSPESVETEIQKLLQDFKLNSKTTNPLKLAFDFHLKFEQIHPFENGNGRTGRFLLNKILLSNSLLPMIVFEENRQAYFNSISEATSGNKRKYYKFMLEQYFKTIGEYWKK